MDPLFTGAGETEGRFPRPLASQPNLLCELQDSAIPWINTAMAEALEEKQ